MSGGLKIYEPKAVEIHEEKITTANNKAEFVKNQGLFGEQIWNKLMKQLKKIQKEYYDDYVENYLEEMGLEIIPGSGGRLFKKKSFKG